MSLLSVPLEKLSQGQITQIQNLSKAHHDYGQTALQRGDYAAICQFMAMIPNHIR